MSYSIELKGPAFKRSAWLEEIRDTVCADSGPLTALSHQWTRAENVVKWPRFWLQPVNGVRGIQVSHEQDGASLTVNVASSRADYELAWDLVRRAIRHGASATGEDEPLNATAEEMDATHRSQNGFFRETLIAEGRDIPEGSARPSSLPCGPIDLPQFLPADTEGCWADMERRLVERMNRYSGLPIARMWQFGTDEKPLIGSFYEREPALISMRSNLVVIRGEDFPPEGCAVTPEDFFAIFGPGAERLGQLVSVPAATSGMLLPLLEKRVPLPSSGPDDDESDAEESKRLLKLGPGLVFQLMAAMEPGESISRKKFLAFGEVLRKWTNSQSPLVSGVAKMALSNPAAVMEIANGGDEKSADDLMRLIKLLSSGYIGDEHAIPMKQCLLELAESVAVPAGGFLGFGAKIPPEQKEWLGFLRKEFRL